MKECIVLAGGLGTRLQSVVKDVPKCMAEVAGKPFLEHLFHYLEQHQYQHIILSLGYKSECIIDWLPTQNRPFDISYVVEQEPLGTGGAIKLAFSKVRSCTAFVVNGDTFFNIADTDLQQLHTRHHADITIALKPMTDFDRYGSVAIDDSNRIVRFDEKRFCSEGLINGGVYLINKAVFDKLNLPDRFSFEKEVMESQIGELKIYGCIQNRYFIDIGIPSDFEKANQDFRTSHTPNS